MKKENMKQNILTIVMTVVIIGLIITILIQSKPDKPAKPVLLQTTDTLFVPKEVIKWKTKTVYSTELDTFIVKDTDTVPFTVQIDHKLYKDTIKTDSSTTYVSVGYHGFASEIDSISLIHNRISVYVPEIPKKKKLNFGITVSVSTGYDILHNTVYFGPGIGIGCSIKF